jgi:acyl-CoA dehydrogenase
MIDFSYTEEQLAIKDMAMKFARNEMMPNAEQFDQSGEFPKEILQKAWELGLVNTSIPSEYGGTDFTTLDAVLISECLAYGCMGMNTSIMANDLALFPIVLSDNEKMKKKYLPQFTEEYKIASFCLTEPDAGSDASSIKTTFKEDGDNYIINGKKMWITNAGFADLYVVYGTVDPELTHKGIIVGLIDKGTKGVEIGKPEKKMGHRCSDTRSMTFNNVKIPKENILAGAGEGWKLAMKTLDHSRPLVASSALGGAQCAHDHSIKYAKERTQFKRPLANHQAIQFMIADMATQIEAARLLVSKAAWLIDQGQSNTQNAAFAKAFAADTAMEITTNAVQIFGGYGYSIEYPVEKLMRDAKLIQIYEGTSQIQRLVIAKEIFSRS